LVVFLFSWVLLRITAFLKVFSGLATDLAAAQTLAKATGREFFEMVEDLRDLSHYVALIRVNAAQTDY
jgi:hypothetical protein